MMKAKSHFSKDFLIAAMILSLAVLIGSALFYDAYAQQSKRNSSISFKKDNNNLFIITIRDPQGIKEFSLQPPGKFSYGGGISGCPTSRVITNVIFDDPFDFTPAMDGYVIDCQDNEDKFQISPPRDGVATAVRVGVEPAPETAPPTGGPAAPAKEAEAPRSKAEEKSPLAKITYPVAELGNCATEFECRDYCDQPANLDKCVAFAESHGLMTKKEADLARKFKEVVKGGGPGSCNSKQSCEVYCDNIDNLDACLAFAEQHEILSGKELDEAKKVQAAIKRGVKMPGDCKSKGACEAYCTNSEHIDECIAFAKDNGFMSEEEIREVEKFLPLMKSGQTPGGCKSKDSCEAYCEADKNFDECIAFAEKAGFLSGEELKQIEKFKKAGGVGPGGCKGRQCEAYCQKPENQKACFDWAKENGFIEAGDLRRMEEGKQQLKSSLGQMPPEVKECVEAIVGPGGLDGDFFGGPEMGQKIQECFEQAFSGFGGPGGPGGFPGGPSGQGGPGGGFGGGPGGCKSIDECTAYCQDHLDECQGFGPPGSGGQSRNELKCSPKGTVASFVCAINGRGARPGVQTTYFNRCTSDQHNAEFLHDGVCEGHAPCANVADPVCGNDGNTWVHACHAEKEGGGVKHAGVCEFSGGQGGFPGGAPPEEFKKQYEQQQQQFEQQNQQFQQQQQQYEQQNQQFQQQQQQQQYQQQYQQQSGGFSGPGGCRTADECQAYCTKNYQDPACQQSTSPTTQPPPPPPPAPKSSNVPWPDDGVNYSQVIYPITSPYHPSYLPILPDSGQYAFKAPTKAGSCVPSSFGLVSWWTGERIQPTNTVRHTAVDIVGGNNGKIISQSSSPYQHPGKVGEAFLFGEETTADFRAIVVPNTSSLNFGTGPFSLEAWFNWNGGGKASTQNIIRKSTTFTGAGYWLRISRDAGSLEFFVGDTSDDPAKPRGIISTPVSAGTWHHVIGTRDSSGTMRLYLDGQLKGTKEAPNADTTNENPFTIGAFENQIRSYTAETFKGFIDEVSIYNTAVDASEVKNIFNLASAGKCISQTPYPQTSVEYRREYVKQQEEYQSYLIQVNGLPPGTTNQ